MFWLHETHHLDGSREDEFEQIVRDEWMPRVAEFDGARLLYFLKHAHGTGSSYRVVTITGIRDIESWSELCAAVAEGAMAGLAQQLDRNRHDVFGKLLLPLPWARESMPSLEAVPTELVEHEPSVFMEDTVWPYVGQLEQYVKAAGDHYAKEMSERAQEGRGILSIEGAYRTAFGAGRRREIVLWQKLVQPAALSPLVSSEVPEKYKRPGTWMHDALELRDQWESRLLRTVSWSPLY